MRNWLQSIFVHINQTISCSLKRLGICLDLYGKMLFQLFEPHHILFNIELNVFHLFYFFDDIKYIYALRLISKGQNRFLLDWVLARVEFCFLFGIFLILLPPNWWLKMIKICSLTIFWYSFSIPLFLLILLLLGFVLNLWLLCLNIQICHSIHNCQLSRIWHKRLDIWIEFTLLLWLVIVLHGSRRILDFLFIHFN